MLFWPSLCIQGRFWNTQVAMGVSSYSTASNFQCWEGSQNLVLTWSLRVVGGRNDMMLTIRDMYMISRASPAILIHLTKAMKYSSGNGCLSLLPSISFITLRVCWKSGILHEIWGLSLAEMSQCWPQGANICCQNLFSSSLCIQGRLWNTRAAMYVSPYSTASNFPCWEGAQNLMFCMNFEGYLCN